MLNYLKTATYSMFSELHKVVFFCVCNKRPASLLIAVLQNKLHITCLVEDRILKVECDEEGHFCFTDSDPFLERQLLQKGLKNWVAWLDRKFDLMIVTGLQDSKVIIRSLNLPLLNKYAIEKVLPFKLEQQLPMQLEETAIGFLIQNQSAKESSLSVHISTKKSLHNFIENISSHIGVVPDFVYPHSLAIFRAASNEMEKQNFVCIYELENNVTAFFSHKCKLISSKTMKKDANTYDTVMLHFQKLVESIGETSLPLICIGLSTKINVPQNGFWQYCEMSRPVQAYISEGFFLLTDLKTRSNSKNIFSSKNHVNRLEKQRNRSFGHLITSIAFIMLSILVMKNNYQEQLFLQSYNQLAHLVYPEKITEERLLSVAYNDVLRIVNERVENEDHAHLILFPRIEKLLAWICKETYTSRDFNKDPLVRLTKFDYFIDDFPNMHIKINFKGYSDESLDIFQQQMRQGIIWKNNVEQEQWTMQKPNGSCQFLLVHKKMDRE